VAEKRGRLDKEKQQDLNLNAGKKDYKPKIGDGDRMYGPIFGSPNFLPDLNCSPIYRDGFKTVPAYRFIHWAVETDIMRRVFKPDSLP
jgi:hypothetical protein